MLSVSVRVPIGADDLPAESCSSVIASIFASIFAGLPVATRFIVGADFRAFEREPVAIYLYGRYYRPSSKRFYSNPGAEIVTLGTSVSALFRAALSI